MSHPANLLGKTFLFPFSVSEVKTNTDGSEVLLDMPEAFRVPQMRIRLAVIDGAPEGSKGLEEDCIRFERAGRKVSMLFTDGFLGFTQEMSIKDVREIAAKLHRLADEAERSE